MWNHASMWLWLNNLHECLDKMLKCIWFRTQRRSRKNPMNGNESSTFRNRSILWLCYFFSFVKVRKSIFISIQAVSFMMWHIKQEKKNFWSHRCSAIIANRRHTQCITTSFHRQWNRLWRNGTERMEFPGRHQTWSIPSLWKGTTGHCQNQMGLDALFITSPQGAPTSGNALHTKGLPGCYRSQKIYVFNHAAC